jgi:hypothetical protein
MADEICRPTGRLALTRVGGKHQKQLDGTESAGLPYVRIWHKADMTAQIALQGEVAPALRRRLPQVRPF